MIPSRTNHDRNRAPDPSARGPIFVVAALLPVLCFFLYVPSLHHDFVNWDDPFYILENPHIRVVNWQTLRGILFETHFTDYYPVNLLSYALDYALWGLSPGGYHLTNAVLHAANTSLVFLVMHMILGGLFAPALAAALFGVHPVQVESVAWVSERKNLLSMFFFLLTFIAFLCSRKFAGWQRGLFYVLSLLCFILGVFSKASIAIFPVIALAYLAAFERLPLRRAIPMLGAFFAIGILGAFSTFWVQRAVNIVRETHGGTSSANTVLQMASVFARYLAMLALPMKFSAYDPHPVGASLFSPWLIPGAVALVAFAIFLGKSWRSDPRVFLCLVWFLAGLAPVSHIIPFPNLMSERYLYLPCVGVFAAAALLARRRLERLSELPALRVAFICTVFVPPLSFGTMTLRWISFWKDSHALWTQTLLVTPHSDAAHVNLGAHYDEMQLWTKAERHLRRGLELEPRDGVAWQRLGTILLRTSREHQAVQMLQNAVRLGNAGWSAHFWLAHALRITDRPNEAETEMLVAYRRNPVHPMPQFFLGLWRAENGDRHGAQLWLDRFLHTNWPGPETDRAREILRNLTDEP